MVFNKPPLPNIEFPAELPVTQKREEIAELIRKHQVVVLAGETGSGKTTQLPKICLQLGRGHEALIGHTQPRRIAARTVASRIAEELKVELGKAVGYQVRFNDQSDPSTYIKLMTDGILLAEIRHDPLLKKYDTLIIDEAHERSLNIDFILGYLKKILPKRPDLKVIVTSATIDLQKFSAHFNNAPIIEVSGRNYPVELVWRPWQAEFEDVNDAIANIVDELANQKGERGDILVFLSGEREIREASHAIKKRELPHLEVLPLYARLSLAEQNRVFQPHKGLRVVLATNVAETSLTVPGIRYVIDPGTARIKRYSLRTKVQRLPIEAISQASANQRAGRCGRVQAGVCIRLYEKADFDTRPEFTEAEILRSNLAGVILQMLQLNIGEVRNFPFVDVPDKRLIKDGYRLLEELGAVNKRGHITEAGRIVSDFQIDPLLARMLLEAKKFNCLREMLVIVSGLSIQDIRERPAEKKQHADELHRRFWDENSDFLSLLNLWNYLEEQRQTLSQSQLRKLCQREYLNYLRYREWRDLHHQLRLAVRSQSWRENQEEATYEFIHRALLSGLLSNVGQKNEETGERNPRESGQRERPYKGTRNSQFSIFPGSSQYKKRPAWITAAEMLETSQLFAHCVAKIETDWVVDAGKHVTKVQQYEPWYQGKSGQVMAFQRTTLFGLILREKERVSYGGINPQLSREIFIRSALVEGKYTMNPRARGEFFVFNQKLIESVLELEARSRRRDIMVDDEKLYAFYDERLPENIVNLAAFEHWRKRAEHKQPELLHMQKSHIMLHSASDISEEQFPKELQIEGVTYKLYYHFEPGHAEDGVNIRVPVSLLHQLPEGGLEWLVPGLLREKCVSLLKLLPKYWRKQLVPVPQTVDNVLQKISPGKLSLSQALADQLKPRLGQEILEYTWPHKELDAYYRFNVRVEDEQGELIDQGRDLSTLREKYRTAIKDTLAQKAQQFEVRRMTTWEPEVFEERIEIDRGNAKVLAYPMLVDKQNCVELHIHDNPLEARWQNHRGKVRLAFLHMQSTVKYIQKDLLKGKDLLLSQLAFAKPNELFDDLLMTAISASADFNKVTTKLGFEKAVEQIRAHLLEKAQQLEKLLLEVAQGVLDIRKQMKASKNALALAFAYADINAQMEALLYKDFMYQTQASQLEHFPRYLRAISLRLEKVAANIQRDRIQIESLQEHISKHQQRLAQHGQARFWAHPEWQSYRWMLEELRISLFAQQLKTAVPVSDKRLRAQWQTVIESDLP